MDNLFLSSSTIIIIIKVLSTQNELPFFFYEPEALPVNPTIKSQNNILMDEVKTIELLHYLFISKSLMVLIFDE
jgi:hypothetical protein